MKDSFHANTKIIGLLGHPIKHSYSPFVQNVAFEFEKLDYIYLAFDVPPANLKSALNGVVVLGMEGLNVTLPHKEKIIQYLDELSEEATTIGAVNTIVNDHGKLIGYNTDVAGIIETLLPFKEQISGSAVSVLGAGGGARGRPVGHGPRLECRRRVCTGPVGTADRGPVQRWQHRCRRRQRCPVERQSVAADHR